MHLILCKLVISPSSILPSVYCSVRGLMLFWLHASQIKSHITVFCGISIYSDKIGHKKKTETYWHLIFLRSILITREKSVKLIFGIRIQGRYIQPEYFDNAKTNMSFLKMNLISFIACKKSHKWVILTSCPVLSFVNSSLLCVASINISKTAIQDNKKCKDICD